MLKINLDNKKGFFVSERVFFLFWKKISPFYKTEDEAVKFSVSLKDIFDFNEIN